MQRSGVRHVQHRDIAEGSPAKGRELLLLGQDVALAGVDEAAPLPVGAVAVDVFVAQLHAPANNAMSILLMHVLRDD